MLTTKLAQSTQPCPNAETHCSSCSRSPVSAAPAALCHKAAQSNQPLIVCSKCLQLPSMPMPVLQFWPLIMNASQGVSMAVPELFATSSAIELPFEPAAPCNLSLICWLPNSHTPPHPQFLCWTWSCIHCLYPTSFSNSWVDQGHQGITPSSPPPVWQESGGEQPRACCWAAVQGFNGWLWFNILWPSLFLSALFSLINMYIKQHLGSVGTFCYTFKHESVVSIFVFLA